MDASYDPIKKIWYGPQTASPYNPKIGLGELILHSLDCNSDKVSQISDDFQETLTCKEIRLQSIRAAENLKKFGIKFGDVCALISRNNPEVAPVVFGCLIIGAPLNTLDTAFGKDDITHMFNLTKPKAVFCEPEVHEHVKSAYNKLGLNPLVFLFNTKYTNFNKSNTTNISELFVPVTNEKNYHPVSIPNTEKHIAMILCSSGTTGPCKGVCLSHAQIISQTLRVYPSNSDDIMFAFSSLYWLSGISILFIGTVVGCTRIITTEPFTPKLLFRLIEQYKLSQCFMPPSQAALCLESENIKNANLKSIKKCILGGSAVLEEIRLGLKEKFHENAVVIVVYGLTELATTSNCNFKYHKKDSVGPPNAQNSLKIIDESGNNLGPDETGEVCIFSPFPFVGYYGSEEQNRDVYDEDGWIHSGDLGFIDEEGYLFIVGRKKEIIKHKNYQISPESIESIIQQKTGLMQVCAVPVEDAKHGTDLPAVVIVRPESCLLSEKDIIKISHENVTGFKELTGGIYFVDKFPMTPSGKIKRRAVKDLANQFYRINMENMVN